MDNELPQFPSDDFVDFHSGVPVDHNTVNEWIRKCYEQLKEHPEMSYTFIASGNTHVEVNRYSGEGYTEYRVQVSQGFYEASFVEQ